MMPTNGKLPSVVILSCLLTLSCVTVATRQKTVFMNQFAVHVPGGRDKADAIAEKHGFDNIGQIGSLKDYYLLEHKRIHKRSLERSDYHHELLSKDPHVHWFAQQAEKKRKKRDFTSSGFDSFPSDFSSLFASQSSHHKTFRSLTAFVDPLFKEEWYLNGGAKEGYDMNVGPAWTKGYTGKGVVVSILDDGIQTNHPDLAQNYDPAASTDINGNDDDPMPRDNGDNKHGTRCAGEVAAVANNAFCGVGVAYNASIGGVRMLDGSVNDAVEARALSLNPDHIDIYSASWGPEDDGKTVDGPGPLARRAFINGVTTGRKGKGSIFVWASGNGGRHTDSCNCDGYTNSIFTLSISSATQGGYKPWYLEECSSTLATTYSSGTPGHDKSIATVDMDGQLRPDHICTVEHTGTSASAPLASGLCALALEANPELTWRDMQHIVVMTSNPQPLMKENGWITNGVSRKVSHKFGYGLMDGGAMVALAEQWTTVPPQHICKSPEVNDDRSIDPSYGSVLTTSVDASGCPGSVNEVRHVEHVQCKVSLRCFPRGNLRLVLTSPSGTPSTLLMERPRDVVASNFDDWPFLSVHFWGENPKGRWTLQVINAGNRHVNQAGILRKWQLIFYGTSTNPVRLRAAAAVRPSSFFASPSQQPALASFFPGVTTADIFSNPSFKAFPNIFSGQGSEIDNSKVPLDGSSIAYNEVWLRLKSQPGNRRIFDRVPREAQVLEPVQTTRLAEGAACHESCGTCAGPSLDSCLTCATGLLYVTDLGLCLQKCPDGYYEDASSSSCIGCHGNCASCPEGPATCSSCDHHLILYNGTCVASCPKQTYETDDYRCSDCDPSCETCIRDGPEGCVTCPNGDKASVTGRCAGVDYCPNSHCTRCSEKEGEILCIECNRGFLLDPSGVCLPDPNIECRPGEYMTNNGCQPCVDASNCTRCPQALNILNNTCVVSCGLGYFSDSGWCQRCASNCVECLGERSDQCLSCVDGYKISPYGTCLASCPGDTYSASWGCVRCHHFCSSCSGEGPYACTSCTAGRYLDAASKLCMPCVPCDPNNQHQCCHCDPTTGKCHLPAGKRRITSEQAARAHEDELIAEASMTHENRVFAHSRGPQYASLTVAAIVSCATVILVFGIIIFVVQMKTRDSSRRGYTKVPIREMRFSSFVEPHKQSRIRFTQIAQDDLEYDDDDEDEHVILTAAKS